MAKQFNLLNSRLVPPVGSVLPTVYFNVQAERIRAHQKHGAKGNSREDAHWSNNEWLPILVEEVGEVAHELTYDAKSVFTDDQLEAKKAALRAELVQVAAMACAWIAAIDEATA